MSNLFIYSKELKNKTKPHKINLGSFERFERLKYTIGEIKRVRDTIQPHIIDLKKNMLKSTRKYIIFIKLKGIEKKWKEKSKIKNIMI